jgi:hypothetical protein
MKALFLAAIISCSFTAVMAQTKDTKTPAAPDKNKEVLMVEAACGQCKFELPGNSCDLAVRMNGKAYFVDGSNIDSHGDAHAKDGFCNAIRKANVQGEIVDGRFKATYFQLIPESAKKKQSN